ncbi:ROK family protein [Streptomyces sioyaensis]|uniref:ROK family protein n=1 Tax=Streptomyces sioyaensis TaxID=67364 RepID=A0A4Q1RBL6_9ACTN|nr:ROK family protein [Streptomyces sioyaensis]MBM4793771.1 ROK family protein [Streptomyces sioyaensis]RXS70900.1 ROK family protein [Streptomyces sioyaensis]
MRVFGVDIGGSGIKGAPVDLERGDLADERYKVLTPHPATPDAVADGVKQVVDHFGWSGPVGATFPGVVTEGTTRTAANVDKAWIGTAAGALLTSRLGGEAGGSPVTLLNDADAAGLAEMRYGAGRGRAGTVIVLTLGTGIGSALFTDGRLVPNTELGHLELHGHDAEKRASTKVKEDEGLSWQHWAHRVQKYLAHVEMLFSPELFVIGGGVSRKAEKFLPLIEGIRAEIVPAQLQNNAGIVGAAMAAHAVRAGEPPAADGSRAAAAPGPQTASSAGPAARAVRSAVDSPVGWPDDGR